MSRWEPNTPGRLQQAALELYLERGYEQTTVAQIAARAGLTERTFFRHFADKREVLFDGSGTLRELLLREVTGAPAGTGPVDAVAAALLTAAGTLFEEHVGHERARLRQIVIMANPALQERELIKLAGLATDLAGALRGRGVTEPAASLAAEAGMAVFRIAFERWCDGPGQPRLPDLIQESLAELRAVTAAGSAPPRSS